MTMRLFVRLSAVPLLLAPSAPAATAPPKEGAKAPVTLSARLEGMKFRSIGPYRGGRVTAVTGVRGQPMVFYFGATGGGVFKTTDGGAHWDPVSDRDFRRGSIGAIDVSDSDPNVVWVGTGEGCIRGNLSSGDGVWKSTDAGRSWKNVGLKESQQIAKVVIHPSDPDVVWVAAQGHPWGPNPERGVYKTTDGGTTWRKVLYVDERSGAADLAIDPTNPRILYAAIWEHVRRPWTMESGGPGSGLWKTTDGGETWKKLSGGLPEGVVGKIGVAVSASNPERVFALVEAEKGGLYRSDDGGGKWTRVSADRNLIQRAWYYTHVFAHPKNPDVVFVANVRFHRSADGGKTFRKMRVKHGDHHDLWIDPDDPDRMIEGDDGGATVTFNGGKSWSTEDNQPTAQIYRLATDDRFPYWLYGAQQDNTDIAIPSAVAERAIDRTEWYPAGGGESGWVQPDPRNPDVIYGGSYGGTITRHDRKTRQSREIIAWPQPIDGQATRDLKYRFNWNAPILLSRQHPGVLYHAAQKLLRTTDEGTTWTEVSPDLTRDDKSKQGYAGGPITREITGVETYDTIFCLAESPHEKDVLWAGTDDGLVWVTRDGTKSWQNVTPPGLPAFIQINAIEVSPHEAGGAFVAAVNYKLGDDRPYVYRTGDYGKTWTKAVNGLPPDVFVRVVREDPARPGLLFAGTEAGLFVSLDGGGLWQPFRQNLPPVPVTDLEVKEGDLLVATQGRGFYILDDVTPLRRWEPGIAEAAVHLFPPRPTVRMRMEEEHDDEPAPRAAGENGPAGVVVWYWLKEAPKDPARPGEKLTIEVLQGDRLLRRYTNEKKEGEGAEKGKEEDEENGDKPLEPRAGLNRLVWDMRLLAPAIATSKETFGDYPPEGPRVVPGTYTVRLTVGTGTPGAAVVSGEVVVKPDPRVAAPPGDLAAQYDLLTALREDLERAHEVLRKVREMRAQAREVSARADRLGIASLKAPGRALEEKLGVLEETIANPKIKASQDTLNFTPKLDFQIAALAGIVDSADARPTAAAYERRKELSARLAAAVKEFEQTLAGELAAFNRAVEEAKIPPVTPLPPKKT